MSVNIFSGKIDKKQKERRSLEEEIRLLNNEVNELSLKEGKLLKEKNIIQNKIFQGKWVSLHKDYNVHLQNIKVNGMCPMCSNELSTNFIQKVVRESESCFLCHQEILKIENRELENEFKIVNGNLSANYFRVNAIQKDILIKERALKKLDGDFKVLSNKIDVLKSNVRILEYKDTKDIKKDELNAFYEEIKGLEKLKSEYQIKSQVEIAKAKKISAKIEASISKNTQRFSSLFSEFAESFLGTKCSLSYTDLGEGKRLYPIIGTKLRRTEEELSESQRFFVDHSFRMSILSFFYSKPTFYIVETADSSLDIAYEQNAADVFEKFLEKPNTLILTTNLNNSEFISHLIQSKTEIGFINLLEIGKKSSIQQSSKSMKKIYSKIQKIIQNEG